MYIYSNKFHFVLFQAARTVLHSAEPVSQMLADWKQIDFEGIARQGLWTFSNNVDRDYELIKKCTSVKGAECEQCSEK